MLSCSGGNGTWITPALLTRVSTGPSFVSIESAQRFNAPIAEGLYGAFGYTAEKDVVRAPMRVDTLPYRVEQLVWEFVDMTVDGGRVAVMWDKTMASVPFNFGR